MEIKRGTWRIVFLIPAFGVAIKFPRVYFVSAWSFIKVGFWDKNWWLREFFHWNINSMGSLKQWLFKGTVENFREFLFYLMTRHPFCVPTYFSLFGLCNIQKLGAELNINRRDLRYQLVTLTANEARGHHFDDPANFSYKYSKLQILDYGDPRVQKVVKEFGLLLQEKFDINTKCPHKGIISG